MQGGSCLAGRLTPCSIMAPSLAMLPVTFSLFPFSTFPVCKGEQQAHHCCAPHGVGGGTAGPGHQSSRVALPTAQGPEVRPVQPGQVQCPVPPDCLHLRLVSGGFAEDVKARVEDFLGISSLEITDFAR